MSKNLTIGNKTFKYPDTGDINYGEEASGWAEAATDKIAEFSGPGDINTTEAALVNNTTGDVTGLSFDTSFVQQIEITWLITRKFNSSSTKTESFTLEGSYDGTEFNYTLEFSGNDTEVELFFNVGQVRYTADNVADTSEMSIKFRAKTIIDEEAI